MDVIIGCGKFVGYGTVGMPMAEVPMPELNVVHHPLQKPCQLHIVGVGILAHTADYLTGCGVGDYIIYAVIIFGEILYRLTVFSVAGQLLLPIRKSESP